MWIFAGFDAMDWELIPSESISHMYFFLPLDFDGMKNPTIPAIWRYESYLQENKSNMYIQVDKKGSK